MGRHGDYLYRRNGRFYARLRIPQTLHDFYDRSDLRASLDTPDYGEARLRVLERVLSWKRDFQRIQKMLDARQLVAGSPILLGAGLIQIDSAARECGLSVGDMLAEARNRRLELRIAATGWNGVAVTSDALEFDYDGSLIHDATLLANDPVVIVGELFLRDGALNLIADGVLEDTLFFRDAKRTRAVVVEWPGVSVPFESMLIAKADAEAIRAVLAARVSPAMLEAAQARQSSAAVVTIAAPAHKHAAMRCSELLEKFYKAHKSWAPSTRQQNESMCNFFAALMNDPALGDIDSDAMLQYFELLQTLPENVYQTSRKFGTNTPAELLEAAKAHNLPTMLESRARIYVVKIKGAFLWAVRKNFMPTNPAAGTLERENNMQPEQDDRDMLSDENLHRIFSAIWFQDGRGVKTKHGEYRQWQPHFYWLPLLGLYTGARINELSQLHIKDVLCTGGGRWYIDFNLDGSGKIDEPDKRLKNVNSIRKVPLHPELVRLGLPGYVTALRDAGHERLFPELRHDPVKGYGAAAGSWFGERFLGYKLKIPRDGKQTFHSFRHNFTSGLFHIEPALSEATISQLTGHRRGKTEAGRRYRKDLGVDQSQAYVSQLKFNVPPIATFDIAAGLEAIRHALERKEFAARTARPKK